jgi:hypothetical protein
VSSARFLILPWIQGLPNTYVVAPKIHTPTHHASTVFAEVDPLAFDPKQMRAAFDAGRALAKQPDPWSTAPPTLGDIPTCGLDVIKQR